MKLPVETLIVKYQNRLYGAAFAILQNTADAQDAVQLTMIKYLNARPEFKDEEEIRKWLFRVVCNQAKDLRRSFFRKNVSSIETMTQSIAAEDPKEGELFAAVSKLPEKDRVVLQLFYYENYRTKDIAQILRISEAAVRKRLQRARQVLKQRLKEEWEDDEPR